MLPLKAKTATLRWTWLLLVLAAFAIYPALAWNIGPYAYDAGTVHIYQGVVYSDAVSSGALYPRWVQPLHLGLGSPLFTFRTPLAYASMDILSRLGFPHPIGWRLMVAAGLLAGCIGAYLLVYELTSQRWPAILGAVTFLYAPYLLRNAFERGSTEAFGTFFYPWVLWGLIRLARRPSGARLLAASTLWAGCIAAHVLAPLMLAPVALVVAILAGWRPGKYTVFNRTPMPFLALLAGGLLTAFIWAPMASEQRWVHIERDFQAAYADPARNPLPLDRLLALPAVYDPARDNNGTGDRIGLWHMLWLGLGLPAAIYAWLRGRRDLALILGLATVLGLLLFWMLTAASDPLWQWLEPLLRRLQYRSRLMGVQAVAIAGLAGAALALLSRRWQPRLALLLGGAMILSSLPSLFVDLQHRYAPFGDSITLAEVRQAEIASGGTAFTYFGEFMPRWRTAPLDAAFAAQLGPDFDPEVKPLADPPAGVTVSSARVRSGLWDLTVGTPQPATLTLHLLYYPRWKAFVDGLPSELRPQPETGYAQLDVPEGAHEIQLRYGSTPAERAGVAVSLLALCTLFVIAVIPRHRMTRPPRNGKGQDDPLLGAADTQRPVPSTLPAWWLLIALTGLLAVKIFYVDAFTSWLRCVSTATRVCGAQATVDVPFASGPRLRGYSVSATGFKAGDLVRVGLYWQGERDSARRLSSFVHIRNSVKDGPMNPRTGNELWAQDEHESPGGILTTEYLPGRLYLDEFHVRLSEDMPPGTYFLEVGWADSSTAEQLDPQAESVRPPLGVLWRSVLLPSVEVR